MEFFLRLYTFITKVVNFLLTPIFYIVFDFFGKHDKLPPLKSPLLQISAVDLAEKIRNREITSEAVVREYIERVKEVESFLNAVVEHRFDEAIKDAQRADKIIADTSEIYIIKNYPLLGVPFTVKESVALKNLSHGTATKPREGMKADKDAVVVERLRAAGAIPLLVSTTPEYCVSWETYNHVSGRTLNPHNLRRTPGGSSGGEAALVGAGASCFGIGSDIAGSIRIPSHFVGIFGHKPTPGIISLEGHFPNSADKNFAKYLTIGPMCRYAKDLPTLTYLMADEAFHSQLRLDEPLYTTDLKIYFLETAGYSLSLCNVNSSIQRKMLEAVAHFKSNGVDVERTNFDCDMHDTMEISICTFFAMDDIPDLFHSNDKNSKRRDLWNELAKSIFGYSDYTLQALYFYALLATGGFIPPSKREHYIRRGKELRQKILDKLKTNGVFFYPTFPLSAMRHNESVLKLSGVTYSMIWNIMGFPSTHVPMGKDDDGLPIGFQIVAAPYQDRNCFCIAREIEAAFGGWKL